MDNSPYRRTREANMLDVDDDLSQACPACDLPALMPKELPTGSLVMQCVNCGQRYI